MKFIYSNGGYAREFSRCIIPNEDIYFVDDNPQGYSISYEEALEMDPKRSAQFTVGFADPKLRSKKTRQVIDDGFSLFDVRASTAIVGDNILIGEGSILSDYTILTCDAEIGMSFHANIYSYVAHDCKIGDFVTLAPRVSINGRVVIEDHVYIGTGATILPGTLNNPIVIGKGSVVGAHALVTKSVEPETTVVGSPAKPLMKR